MKQRWTTEQALSGILYDYETDEYHHGQFRWLDKRGDKGLASIRLEGGLDVAVLILDRPYTTMDWQSTQPQCIEDAPCWGWVSAIGNVVNIAANLRRVGVERK